MCSVGGCEKPYSARGFCATHYEYWRIHGDPVLACTDPEHPCRIEGCHRPVKVKIRRLCGTHDQRLRLHGSTDERPKGNRTRRHSVDEHYFDEIDSADKAYWLGFIAGDGYVREDRGALLVRLATRDEAHLGKLREALGASTPIRRYMNTQGKSAGKPYAGLYVLSMPLVRALASHGVVQAKSLILQPWRGPAELMRHYWRGLIDADGTIMAARDQWQVSLVGSQGVVHGFADWVRGLIPETTARPHRKGNIWIFRVRGRVRCRAIALALYGDCASVLDRKKQRADKLIAAGPAKRVGHPTTQVTRIKIGQAARERHALKIAEELG
jgi:hypothetical protein